MLRSEENEDRDWRMIMLTPEEAQQRYQECIAFINTYMTETFSLDSFTPVLKDVGEKEFYGLQFAINYLHSFSNVPPQDKALLVAWVLQIAFWMGYTEGKDKTEIELPKGFYDALEGK